MSVQGFDYDLFVSYAHHDNKLPVGTQATYGWVTALAHNLNLGPSVVSKRIAIDHQLKPGDAFNEDLLRQVDGSAVLLIALSQNYVDSQWCGRELSHFVATHSDDPAKPRNVVVVELAPYEDLVDVPPAIEHLRRELIHAKFWSRPLDSEFHLIAGYPSPAESGLAHIYWPETFKLTQAIDKRLRVLRAARQTAASVQPQRGDGSDKATGLSGTGPLAVLLAAVTADLEPQRRELARALEAEVIPVLPENDYAARPLDELEQALTADLGASILFVQLLSPAPGRAPRGADRPLPQIQFARADKAGLPVLQWAERIPRSGEIDDPAHAALLATPHLRTINLERFKDEVLRRYRDLAASQATRTPAPQAAPRTARKAIFLDDVLGDREQSEWIRGILRREQCEIRSPPKGTALGDGFPVRELMRPCCAGLTVYPGRRDFATVAQRLYWCLNQIAEHGLPLARWGVHLGRAAGEVDLAAEFGIDSRDVVAIPGMTPQGEASLVSFVRGL